MKFLTKIKYFLIAWASIDVAFEEFKDCVGQPEPLSFDFLSPKRLNPYYWKIKKRNDKFNKEIMEAVSYF